MEHPIYSHDYEEIARLYLPEISDRESFVEACEKRFHDETVCLQVKETLELESIRDELTKLQAEIKLRKERFDKNLKIVGAFCGYIVMTAAVIIGLKTCYQKGSKK